MRHAFFSFHYDDVWRCNIVRNCWLTGGNKQTGFVDRAEFEKVERKGQQAIHRWIDREMKGASVTVVLIGSETVNRPYVQYEIEQSWNNKMGLVGIHINALHGQDRKGKVDWGEENYLLKFCNKINIHKPTSQPEIRNNIGDWIEKAAQDAGR